MRRMPQHSPEEPQTMSERRYSDDDVHRILTGAAESEAASEGSSEANGMTLAEIQRIAAEAGLSPSSVTAAAAALEHAPPALPAQPRLLGLPVGVGHSVSLARALNDDEWRRLVSVLRDTFEAEGREEQAPGRRAWRNGNLRVAVETVGEETLLHMRTRKESARGYVSGGVAMIAASGVTTVALAATHANPSSLSGVLIMALGGVALTVAGALQLPKWSSRRREQFAAVADYARRLTTGRRADDE